MKPFNLEEALAGKAVMMRNGEKAYIRHHETDHCVQTDEVLLGYDMDGEFLTWCENGNFISTTLTSDSDIIGMYPETRVINGFEVPVPEAEAPKFGTSYYVASPFSVWFYISEDWDDDSMSRIWLERGLVFLNKEDAITTAKAMLGIDPKEKKNETI